MYQLLVLFLFSTLTCQAEVLVMLKEKADLISISPKLERKKKTEAVYHALVSTALSTQGGLVEFLKSKNLEYRQFFIVNAVWIKSPDVTTYDQILKRPEVEKIIGNPVAELKIVSDAKTAGMEFLQGDIGDNLIAIGADRVWSELKVRGEGIVIGGQDTGYQWDHPALMNQYRGWNGAQADHDYNWHDSIHYSINQKANTPNLCGYDSKEPCDDYRHGTHTMGTMVGAEALVSGQKSAKNQIGVAPGARWIGCRNMDAGVGSPATYLECFQFFLAPTPRGGDPFTQGLAEKSPDIINNSWECGADEGCEGSELGAALTAMKAAGILVVAASGNHGLDPSADGLSNPCGTILNPPAIFSDRVFVVGAYDHRTGMIAGFSSRGPAKRTGLPGPSVTAPGVGIRSSVPGSDYEDFMWSGTSMASPHTSGLAALVMSAKQELIGNVDGVIRLIEKTARPTLGPDTEVCGGANPNDLPNNTFGYGIIRAFEAVKAAISE